MRKSRGAWMKRQGASGLWAVAVALLLSLCLGGCSDQILDPTPGSLSLNEGSGNGNSTGNGHLVLSTEPQTGSVIVIQPTEDPFENAKHVMRVDFLNTGNSDAILLRLDDTVILMDTGESDDYAKISGKLGEYGITTIDYLIISHFDNDHVGTAAQVLQDYTVKTVYMPDYVRDSSLYRRMESMLEILGAKTEAHRLTEDVRIELAYGSLWINPTRLYEAGLTLGSDNSHAAEENNFSLITSVYFGDISLLLAGDAEQDRMAEFSALVPEGECVYDVVKIPHHGGYDKSVGDFLRQTEGIRYCMVHAGDKSLVEASLVTAMRTAGAAAYYTYEGDVRFATDGVSMVVEQE